VRWAAGVVMAAQFGCSPVEHWDCREVRVEVALVDPDWNAAASRAVATYAEALAPMGVDVTFGQPGEIAVVALPLGDMAGLTRVESDSATGSISSALVRLNTRPGWSAGEECISGRLDVEAVVAHELGHAFGLQHSANPDATMYGTPEFCDVDKRTLHEEDVAALADLYAGCAHD
jgi:predicted Zn-dependent protease